MIIYEYLYIANGLFSMNIELNEKFSSIIFFLPPSYALLSYDEFFDYRFLVTFDFSHLYSIYHQTNTNTIQYIFIYSIPTMVVLIKFNLMNL